MTEAAQTGLVERIMDALANMPITPAIADLAGALGGAGDQPTAAERRARLALRIALMKRGEFTATAAVAEDALPEPEEPQAPPEPEPAPFIAAPPPKPPRVSMSTVRLEDAAFLLSAFAAPTEPEAMADPSDAAPPKIEAAPVAPKPQGDAAPVASGLVDVGDLAATFAAMEPSAPEPEPAPAPQAPPKDTAPTPPSPKAKRKPRSASPDIAAAAAALAALQGLGDEDPESATSEPPEDK